MGPYKTIDDIAAANKAAGHKFFSPEMVRQYFSSVECQPVDGRFFITSEKAGWNDPRTYTVRSCDDEGNIITHTPGFPLYQEAGSAMMMIVKASQFPLVESDGSDLLDLAEAEGMRFDGRTADEVTLYYKWRSATFEYGHAKPLTDLRYALEEIVKGAGILAYDDTPAHFAEWAHDLGYDFSHTLESWHSVRYKYPWEEAVGGWTFSRSEAQKIKDLLAEDFERFQIVA